MHGISELNKIYKLQYSALITLINVRPNIFVIRVKNRHGSEISYKKYDPPLLLNLERAIHGRDEPPGFTGITTILPYRHDKNHFKHSMTKWLSSDDMSSDFLVFSLILFDVL